MNLKTTKCIWLIFLLNCSFATIIGHSWNAVMFSKLLQSLRKLQKLEEKQSAKSTNFFTKLPQNPEVWYSPPEVILNRGYPAEIHRVTTSDGYILEVHRIPPKVSQRKVVFLQHGVIESSGTWLSNPNSLAILLAEKGYDVWLGNARGNRYSQRHVSLDPKSSEFWKFGWDEMANYDIPAVINYILDRTGQSTMSYVGHSLGCGMFFAAMVLHPELSSKIDIMVALAPLSSFAHFKSLITTFSSYGRPVQAFLKLLGNRGWLDSQGKVDRFFNRFCYQTYGQARYCKYLVNKYAVGPGRPSDLLETVPLVGTNIFRGTSVRVISQFVQNYNAGEVFLAYDFGPDGNLQKYGSTKPFEYDLTKITVPIYVFSGGNDYIVAPEDVDWLLTKLKNLKGSTRLSDYNHGSPLWATDAKEKIYDKLISLLPSP